MVKELIVETGDRDKDQLFYLLPGLEEHHYKVAILSAYLFIRNP